METVRTSDRESIRVDTPHCMEIAAPLHASTSLDGVSSHRAGSTSLDGLASARVDAPPREAISGHTVLRAGLPRGGVERQGVSLLERAFEGGASVGEYVVGAAVLVGQLVRVGYDTHRARAVADAARVNASAVSDARPSRAARRGSA